MILAIQCNNGFVVWRTRRNVQGVVTYECANDGFKVTFGEWGPPTIQGLGAVAQHTIALQGPIQRITSLPF